MNRPVALLAAGVFLLSLAEEACGQEFYDRVFGFFPENLPGLVTDPPVVTTEDDGLKTYSNVSMMYYAPGGDRVIEIKLKDFNLNPKNYEEEFDQVRKSEGQYTQSVGRSFLFQNFTAFEKRKENVSSWILFLGNHVILEITSQGADDDFASVKAVASLLNIQAMKEAFLVVRSKGRM